MKIVPFEKLGQIDLIIDAVYACGSSGNAGDDPIHKMLPGSGVQGGFRISGRGARKKFVVLYTSGEDADWPDTLDPTTGQFVYYGDNKRPGHELHETSAGGNKLLRTVFERLHSAHTNRADIPPFFIFRKFPTGAGMRSVQFKGVAVPGFPGLSQTEDLVAVWKTTRGQRFQNYRSTFAVLDVPVVERAWVDDLAAGNPLTENAPQAWQDWIEGGVCSLLTSEPTTIIRSEKEQAPDTPLKAAILETIWDHFDNDIKEEKKRRAFIFEGFATKVFHMLDQRVIVDEITRGVVDGGRDAFGRYSLGIQDDPVYAEFSLEAKCYCPPLKDRKPTKVVTKDVSRLISRIRHREFGVLVTTSVIHHLAYQEVREDRHPIIFICGRDIAEILIKSGYNSPRQVRKLLESEFPV